MSYKILFNLIIFAIVAISCKTSVSADKQPNVDIKEIVNNPATTLVDVRIPEQFEAKTAKGAVNIPLATIEDNLDFFKKQKKVVLFCNKGLQATKAAEILKKNGVQNVYFGKTIDNVVAIQNLDN